MKKTNINLVTMLFVDTSKLTVENVPGLLGTLEKRANVLRQANHYLYLNGKYLSLEYSENRNKLLHLHQDIVTLVNWLKSRCSYIGLSSTPTTQILK